MLVKQKAALCLTTGAALKTSNKEWCETLCQKQIVCLTNYCEG